MIYNVLVVFYNNKYIFDFIDFFATTNAWSDIYDTHD